MNAPAKISITPRINLDFHLDDSIANYWYENDPFKTRFMEATFAAFPVGERYFMTSVRYFKDMVKDKELQEDIQAFNRQEAQHGIVHSQFNALLQKKGIPVDRIEAVQNLRVNRATQRLSPQFNLAITAATEHLTALIADAFYLDPKVLKTTDYRVRAMLAWHAMEEMEHKSVAFDVMQKVAKVGYAQRSIAMILLTMLFMSYRINDTRMLLKSDGFNAHERVVMMTKGLWWALGWKGVISSQAASYFSYFKPAFHPEQLPILPQYHQWLEVYTRTGDPIAASESLFTGVL
jgi:predicted metal-dependent hydrolase